MLFPSFMMFSNLLALLELRLKKVTLHFEMLSGIRRRHSRRQLSQIWLKSTLCHCPITATVHQGKVVGIG